MLVSVVFVFKPQRGGGAFCASRLWLFCIASRRPFGARPGPKLGYARTQSPGRGLRPDPEPRSRASVRPRAGSFWCPRHRLLPLETLARHALRRPFALDSRRVGFLRVRSLGHARPGRAGLELRYACQTCARTRGCRALMRPIQAKHPPREPRKSAHAQNRGRSRVPKAEAKSKGRRSSGSVPSSFAAVGTQSLARFGERPKDPEGIFRYGIHALGRLWGP